MYVYWSTHIWTLHRKIVIFEGRGGVAGEAGVDLPQNLGARIYDDFLTRTRGPSWSIRPARKMSYSLVNRNQIRCRQALERLEVPLYFTV